MRIDQAGQERAPADVDAPLDRHDRVLPVPKDLNDLALVVDDQRPESLQLAVRSDLDAAGVVDEGVGECR